MVRRRTLLGGVAASGLLLGLGATPASAANAPDLPIRTCDDWGARPPSAPTTLVYGKPERILVHHTATDNVTDYSEAHAFEHARWIQDRHMDVNGWLDSGQHFTNSRGGFLMEGRHGSLDALRAGDRLVEGAHCPGQNRIAIGIENEGLYTAEEPPREQWDSLVSFCVYTCERYGIAPAAIDGHRDHYDDTVCPGDKLYSLLPRLRQEVARVLG
ncbi:peptidoglycan recognition family protein [Umezawaea sp. Da 62-37]|uniref:peptidoglycan recognition protein family protein n=1 Tax=Umezawaea sp. Da 62-37 TaxID=3075927 RepID=UPI0028F70F06|nr:peptidoglycan recognition family protein [Umezawaea sp. Da 62-37]WNV82166.1 peptidoglycan recognition family protein [Umezawaea sp. Da 62-37]